MTNPGLSKKPSRPQSSGHNLINVGLDAHSALRQIASVEGDSNHSIPFVTAPVWLSTITVFAPNTRVLPIPLARFIQIEWPSMDSPVFDSELKVLLSKEELHEEFDLEKAFLFYLDVYSLAENINRTVLLQPIGVMEHGDGVFTLVFGQRRFMAHFIMRKETSQASIFQKTLAADGYIPIFQDGENEQRTAHSFPDYIRSKRVLYVRGKTQFGTKKELAQYMGVTARTNAYVLFDFYERSDEEEIMSLISSGAIPHMKALSKWLKDNLDGQYVPKPPRRPSSTEKIKNKLRASCIYGLTNGDSDLGLLKMFARLYIEKNNHALLEIAPDANADEGIDIEVLDAEKFQVLLKGIVEHHEKSNATK
jgi:hypothetical protein